jgi:hypothetical protein
MSERWRAGPHARRTCWRSRSVSRVSQPTSGSSGTNMHAVLVRARPCCVRVAAAIRAIDRYRQQDVTNRKGRANIVGGAVTTAGSAVGHARTHLRQRHCISRRAMARRLGSGRQCNETYIPHANTYVVHGSTVPMLMFDIPPSVSSASWASVLCFLSSNLIAVIYNINRSAHF